MTISTQKAQNAMNLITSLVALLALVAGASAWLNNSTRNDSDFEKRLQLVERDHDKVVQMSTDIAWIKDKLGGGQK